MQSPYGPYEMPPLPHHQMMSHPQAPLPHPQMPPQIMNTMSPQHEVTTQQNSQSNQINLSNMNHKSPGMQIASSNSNQFFNNNSTTNNNGYPKVSHYSTNNISHYPNVNPSILNNSSINNNLPLIHHSDGPTINSFVIEAIVL